MLSELAATGVSLGGLDPSVTLAYRAEYVKALGKEAVPPISLPQEWLVQRLDELPQLATDGHPSWTLLPHCTERTNAPAATSDWVKAGRRLGVDLQIAASGCCGMAGLYGHELANRSTSRTIYGLSCGPMLTDARHAGRTLATGYSCRCQAALIDGLQLMHPVQLLLRVVKGSAIAHSLHGQHRFHARSRASRRILSVRKQLWLEEALDSFLNTSAKAAASTSRSPSRRRAAMSRDLTHVGEHRLYGTMGEARVVGIMEDRDGRVLSHY